MTVARSLNREEPAESPPHNQQVKVFAPCGVGGQSSSVKANQRLGLSHFNTYLTETGLPTISEDSTPLEEEMVCTVEVMQRFGTYLFKAATTEVSSLCSTVTTRSESNLQFFGLQTNDALAPGTAKVMFSSAINSIRKIFPKNDIWKTTDAWYGKIAQDVEKGAGRLRIAEGIPMVEKSEPIGRELLAQICRQALLPSASAAKEIQGVKDRVALVTNFSAIGRSGEVAMTSYSLAHWDHVQNAMCLHWQEPKRVKQMPLSFFPDMERMELCWYHAFACYVLVGADSSSLSAEPETWIFPHLRPNAASKVTDILKRYIDRVPDMPRNATGTCLRVGAAMEVTLRTDVVVAAHRGGWDYPHASVSTIMEYMVQSGETLAIGGRALAGWPEPKTPVFPPSCDAILGLLLPEQQINLLNFLTDLFTTARCSIMSSNLRKLGLTMFASLVMYLETFVQQYSDRHVVMVNLFTTAAKFNIPKDTLYTWGIAVRNDWVRRNERALAGAVDWRLEVTALKQSVEELRQQNAQLLQEQAQQRAIQLETLQLLRQFSAMSLGTAAPATSADCDADSAAALSAPALQTAPAPARAARPLSPAVDPSVNCAAESADMATAVQIPAQSAPPTTPTSPPALPSPVPTAPTADVGVKRQRTADAPDANADARSNLHQALPKKWYTVGMGNVDIAELFHEGLRLGASVDHTNRQEAQRVRAVIDYGMRLLGSRNAQLQSIRSRLLAPQAPKSSPQWKVWNDAHVQASAELKEVVVALLWPQDGKGLLSSSVSSIGTRLCKMTVYPTVPLN